MTDKLKVSKKSSVFSEVIQDSSLPPVGCTVADDTALAVLPRSSQMSNVRRLSFVPGTKIGPLSFSIPSHKNKGGTRWRLQLRLGHRGGGFAPSERQQKRQRDAGARVDRRVQFGKFLHIPSSSSSNTGSPAVLKLLLFSYFFFFLRALCASSMSLFYSPSRRAAELQTISRVCTEAGLLGASRAARLGSAGKSHEQRTLGSAD